MKNSEIKIVFFGTPDCIDPILEALQKNFNVVAVIRSTDELTNNLANRLAALNPDLFIVAAYGKIIPEKFLNIPKYGVLNVHPSLLPKYRGASPIQKALLNGDKKIGLTIIKMDPKMDHGPIITQDSFIISGQDNLQTLSTKVFKKAAQILVKLITDFINKKLTLKEQNHNKATFTKIIKKEDGFFDINTPPDQKTLDKMIRAYYPWPTVWTKWKGKIVKFLPAGKIQMEGKKPLDFKDFLNGYPDFPLKNYGNS